MNEVIKNIITRNYTNIDKNILAINDADLLKLFYYFIHFFVTKRISDKQIIILLYHVIYREIPDICYINADNILSQVGSNSFIYNAIIIYRMYNVLKIKIDHVIKMFTLGNNVVPKMFDDCDDIEEFIITFKHDFKDYIDTYDNGSFGNMLNMTNNNTKKLIYDDINDSWRATHEMEMTCRLKLIMKHFGLRLLDFLHITPIDTSEFQFMKYSDKISYYMNIMDELKNSYELTLRLMDNISIMKLKLTDLRATYKKIINNKFVQP